MFKTLFQKFNETAFFTDYVNGKSTQQNIKDQTTVRNL